MQLSRSKLEPFQSLANKSALFTGFDKYNDFIFWVVFENPHQVPSLKVFRSENVILNQGIYRFFALESRMLDKINFGIEKFLQSFSLKIFIDSSCGKKELLDTGHLFDDGLHYW
jgi:hypothetical protein